MNERDKTDLPRQLREKENENRRKQRFQSFSEEIPALSPCVISSTIVFVDILNLVVLFLHLT